ncbi:MAG: NAD(P)-binding domain-containing protein [Chloroflexi bacterium]|nr:NAD(P)-binding domain-containing protein [Chloroflexota bacterium]
MAELSRPFPPGEYPAIVVGSGPGGLQISYELRRLGIEHAVLSADPRPGGMFRRWPFFQRLLSWTKPHAPVETGTRAYERHDWNSLIATEPAARALQPTFMDGSSYFPSRPEMEENLVAFAERAGIVVRYGCEWTGTRRAAEARPDDPRFVVETSDGEYTCRALILAVGIAEPYTPPGDGMEHTHHYAHVRPVATYADRRVLILGKQNSGFELASGMLPWARQLILASPSPAKLSVETRSLVGVRARYVQPYEDHVLGGGVVILDASVGRIERTAGGALSAVLDRSDGSGAVRLEVDDVISATGFVAPLGDLPGLGVQVVGSSRLPVQSPWWESVTAPGVHFAGTLGQGSRGLRKHGIPANSGAVHGARYNAIVLARRLAETRFGIDVERPVVAPVEIVGFVARELGEAPELFHQRGYLGRVVTVDPSGGWRDEGVQPLAHALDAGGPDGLIVTLEADGSGAIFPVLYTRVGGATGEVALEPDPLLDYDTDEIRRAVASVVERVGPVARPA